MNIVQTARAVDIDGVLEAHKNLSRDDVLLALTYCSVRQCDQVGEHCGGCSLRDKQDGIHTREDFIRAYAKVGFLDSDEVVYGRGAGEIVIPGSVATLDQNWQGEDGWIISMDFLKKLAE